MHAKPRDEPQKARQAASYACGRAWQRRDEARPLDVRADYDPDGSEFKRNPQRIEIGKEVGAEKRRERKTNSAAAVAGEGNASDDRDIERQQSIGHSNRL